jgi:hydroxymethylbilane synthase
MSRVRGTDRLIRIGTRSSRLARWQANWVAEQFRALHPGLTVELVEIKTEGDRDRNSPLAVIGGVGVFTKEIQRAVLENIVDLAVHSLKDLPTQQTDGLLLAAVPAREDVADALIAPHYQTLTALPTAARIGTSSPRRRAQLLFFRPDLEIVSLRGNVETRIDSVLEGRLDAVILASAGLHRLGLEHHITQRLGPPDFLPAVGQGALGLECRRDDAVLEALLKPLNHQSSYCAALAERAVLAELQGGCTLPMAAWARDLPDCEVASTSLNLALDAVLFDTDGRERIMVSLQGSHHDPEGFGRHVAKALFEKGAVRVLAQIDSQAEHSLKNA